MVPKGKFVVAVGLLVLLAGCKKEQDAEQAAVPDTRSKNAAAADQAGLERPGLDGIDAAARRTFERTDGMDSTRFAAAEVLLERQVDYLVERYKRPADMHLIRRLIEARIAADDEAIIPLLLGLFSKVQGEERIDFEVYLLSFGSRVESPLIGLLDGADTHLVMRALDALGKLKSTAAVDAIAPLLGHGEVWIRMGAAHALGDIGAPGSVPLLVSTLQDSLHSVVNAALVALGRLRAVEAYDQIRPLLDSDNHHIRKHAAMALGELGDGRALEAVRSLATSDADPGVRFMASKSLAKLEAAQ